MVPDLTHSRLESLAEAAAPDCAVDFWKVPTEGENKDNWFGALVDSTSFKETLRSALRLRATRVRRVGSALPRDKHTGVLVFTEGTLGHDPIAIQKVNALAALLAKVGIKVIAMAPKSVVSKRPSTRPSRITIQIAVETC